MSCWKTGTLTQATESLKILEKGTDKMREKLNLCDSVGKEWAAGSPLRKLFLRMMGLGLRKWPWECREGN